MVTEVHDFYYFTGNPLQYSCLGNLQGMHSSWGRKELDTTEQLSLHSLWPQYWKRSGFIPIPKKGNAKEVSNYCTIALISHASKVMIKFSKLVSTVLELRISICLS